MNVEITPAAAGLADASPMLRTMMSMRRKRRHTRSAWSKPVQPKTRKA